MRNRYDMQLHLLDTQLTHMGELCEAAIAKVTQALKDGSTEQAQVVIKEDEEIDQIEKDIERLCLKLLLQQQPVARDLRRISAALKMITDMERIGDQTSDIAEIIISSEWEKMDENLDKLTARAFDVNNSAYIAGSTADAWNTKDNYSISDDGSSAGFGVTKVNLTLVKKDSIDGLVFLKGAEFALEKYIADGTWTEASLADTSTIVTGEDGTVRILGLDFNYYYRLKETKAPDGYKLPENTYVLIYEADSTKPDVGPKPGFVTDATGPYTDNGVKYTRVHANAGYIYVDNEIANRKISVVKEWKDAAGNNIAVPPVSSVTVDIYKSVNADRYDATEANKVGTATLSADNNWTYTFENLESVDGSGNKLYYFIR